MAISTDISVECCLTSILKWSCFDPGDLLGVLDLYAGVLATKLGDPTDGLGKKGRSPPPCDVLKLTYSSSEPLSSSSSSTKPCWLDIPLIPLQKLSTIAETQYNNNIHNLKQLFAHYI